MNSSNGKRCSVPGQIPDEVLATEGNSKPKKSFLPGFLNFCGVGRSKQSYAEFGEKMANIRHQRKLEVKNKAEATPSPIPVELDTATVNTQMTPSHNNTTAVETSFHSDGSHTIASSVPQPLESPYRCSLYVVNDQVLDEFKYRLLAENVEIKIVKGNNQKHKLQSIYFDQEIDLRNEIIDNLTKLIFWGNYTFRFHSADVDTHFYRQLRTLGKSSNPYEDYGLLEKFFLMCRIYKLDEHEGWQPFRIGRISLVLKNSEYTLLVVFERYDNFYAVIPLSSIKKFKRRTKNKILIEYQAENDMKSIKLQFIVHEDDYFYRKIIPRIEKNTNVSALSEPAASVRSENTQQTLNSSSTQQISPEVTNPQSTSLNTDANVPNQSQGNTTLGWDYKEEDINDDDDEENEEEENRTMNDVTNTIASDSPTTERLVEDLTHIPLYDPQNMTIKPNVQNWQQNDNSVQSHLKNPNSVTRMQFNELFLILIEQDKLSLKSLEKNFYLTYLIINDKPFFKTLTINEEVKLAEHLLECQPDAVYWNKYKITSSRSEIPLFMNALYELNIKFESQNVIYFKQRSFYICGLSYAAENSVSTIPKLYRIEFIKNPATNQVTICSKSSNNGPSITLMIDAELHYSNPSPCIVVLIGRKSQMDSQRVKIIAKFFENDVGSFQEHLSNYLVN